MIEPSTVVQPLTSKLTLKTPPFALKSSVLLVTEPAKLLFPSFTLPPAEKAFMDAGKLAVRLLVTSTVEGDASLPVVSDEKSSLSKVVTPLLLGFTVMTRVAVPVPDPFVAEIVTFDVPATVGIPVISQVDVLRLSPAGKPVAPKEVGLPEAVI